MGPSINDATHFLNKGEGGSKLSMSVYKWEGGQGDGSCGLFSGLESLFSNNDFQKKKKSGTQNGEKRGGGSKKSN